MEIHRKKSLEKFLLVLYQIQKSLLFLSCCLSSSLPAGESGVKAFNIRSGGRTGFGGERESWFPWKSLSGSVSGFPGIDKAISGILLRHRLCCKSKPPQHWFGFVIRWQVCNDQRLQRLQKCTFHFSDMMSIPFPAVLNTLRGFILRSGFEKDKQEKRLICHWNSVTSTSESFCAW